MAAQALSGRAAIVHDPALENYGFGGDHPFNPLRVRLALELCEALGLLEDYPFVSPGPATDEDLTRRLPTIEAFIAEGLPVTASLS